MLPATRPLTTRLSSGEVDRPDADERFGRQVDAALGVQLCTANVVVDLVALKNRDDRLGHTIPGARGLQPADSGDA